LLTNRPADRLLQLFLIYTARVTILRDFITNVYWPHYNAGSRVLQRQDALDFMKSSLPAATCRRIGRRDKDQDDAVLPSALTDFKFTRDVPQGRREIVPTTSCRRQPFTSRTKYFG
jgi:hypothetical protein